MPIKLVDLPEEGLLAELRSADISSAYPDRQGPYTVPEWAKTIVEETFRKRLFTGMIARLYRLTDVYACEEGLIFNEQGQLYAITGKQFAEERITQAHRSVQDGLFYSRIRTYNEPLVQCKRASPFVFGHWMVDMLPMAYLAQALMPTDVGLKARFMVHRTGGPMDKVFENSLRRLNIFEQRLCWTTNEPIFCKEIYLVTGVSDHGHFVTSFVSDCHDRISSGVPGAGSERLFVMRGGYVRKLIGEAELADIARRKGYMVLDPNLVSLDEQIAAFKDARVIVGAMGSSLANLVYTKPAAQVVVLAPESMPDTFFWLICQLRRLRYKEIRCRQVGEALPAPHPTWSRDMVIDPTEFSILLDSIDGFVPLSDTQQHAP